MKLILQAQITKDGYIARKDGLRDWYLKPELFGESNFFGNASAMLYKCRALLAKRATVVYGNAVRVHCFGSVSTISPHPENIDGSTLHFGNPVDTCSCQVA